LIVCPNGQGGELAREPVAARLVREATPVGPSPNLIWPRTAVFLVTLSERSSLMSESGIVETCLDFGGAVKNIIAMLPGLRRAIPSLFFVAQFSPVAAQNPQRVMTLVSEAKDRQLWRRSRSLPTIGMFLIAFSAMSVRLARAQNPVPTISSITFTSVTLGSRSQLLTVNGSNFVSASTVSWNGTALGPNYVSSTVLTAAVPGTIPTPPVPRIP
jgi:hypothetical protein